MNITLSGTTIIWKKFRLLICSASRWRVWPIGLSNGVYQGNEDVPQAWRSGGGSCCNHEYTWRALRINHENKIYLCHRRCSFFPGEGPGGGFHFSHSGMSRPESYQSKAGSVYQ